MSSGHTVITSVWKFPLSESANQTIMNMPEGAEILRLAVQRDVPTIWARVNPKALPVTRIFQIYGTGHPVPPYARYVGTFDVGPFVWHVFELLSDDERVGGDK